VVSTQGTYGDYYTSDQTGLVACKGFIGFRLTGPGVNLTTTLDYGDSSGEILSGKFRAGATYTIQDDHNIAGTRRTFTVTRAASIDVPLRGVLTAEVSTKGALMLTVNGKQPSSLRQGKWSISAHDASLAGGFTLQQAGKPALVVTSAAFVGYRDMSLTLTPGRWTYFSPGHEKHTFVVS